MKKRILSLKDIKDRWSSIIKKRPDDKNQLQSELERLDKFISDNPKFPYFIIIEDFQANIDLLIQEIVNSSIGFNLGDCLLNDGLLCPDVEENKEGIVEVYNDYIKLTGKSITLDDFISQDTISFSYDHSHLGNWIYYWFKKTGYDYGISLFLFKNKGDAELAQLIYILGSNYVIK